MAYNITYTPSSWNPYLADELAFKSDVDVLRHALGFAHADMPTALNESHIVCLDFEWWEKDPKPTTEIGIAELFTEGQPPSAHAENILTGIQTAHARIMPHAHLLNNFPGAGNREVFHFGTTKFVTVEESKQVLINTFVHPRDGGDGTLQPIILIGHAIENELDHIQRALEVDLRSYGAVVKVIDTQVMAKKAGIVGPNGPNIGLHDLLQYFNIQIDNLHSAGNDAAATLIVAILLALKDGMYRLAAPTAVVQGRHIQDVVDHVMSTGKSSVPPPWGRQLFCTRCGRENHIRTGCHAKVRCSICYDSNVVRLLNASTTHMTAKCLYNYLPKPAPDHDGTSTVTTTYWEKRRPAWHF
jgi:hypothetical protein